MKITFFSNFLVHHQTPFCNEMYRILGDDFTFVATEEIPEERVKFGYKDLSDAYPYCLNSYRSEEENIKAHRLNLESDIVILGNNPNLFLRERVLSGKIVFRYSERFFKKGRLRIFDPRVAKSLYMSEFRYRKSKNLSMLCASAYTASDCRFIFSYPGRTYKWGYFTEIKEQNIKELMKSKSDNCVKILWVARFIALKHPEKAIGVVKKLIDEGLNVKLDFIGSGELEEKIKKMVKYKKLEKHIAFLGSMSPEEVALKMESANIFIFTSDRREGWGAVINESMAAGCAVVSNKHIGSTLFLIKNGENGLIYNGSQKDLFKKVKELVTDKEKCIRLGEKAYLTMKNEWSPEIAAERFVEFCRELLKGNVKEYEEGPLSRA